ncbi:hypothetical protein J4E81_010749 [Alternaria sp. BMP 2799]|nr:hypothetical protein J4E81_010749 [Alternaria sp. BMP 2799]
MDILLDDLDDGRNLKYSQLRLEELPPELEDIYERMLVCSTKESEQDRYERLRFFQWIIFANRPMRLQEWYTIAGMIQVPPPSSFEQWSRSARNPVDAVEEGHDLMNRKHEDIQSDRGYGQDQLLKWIQRVSRGLVEVSYSSEKELSDNASALAGQGSVLSNIGESRTINVIHTSVRDFFRQSLTFGGLVPAHERLTTSEIHMYPSNQVLSKKEKYRQHKSLIPAPSILAEQDKMPEIEDADSIRYSTVRGYRSSLGAPVRRYRLSRIPKILAERDKMPEIEDAESIRYIPVREYTSSLGAPVRTNRSPHIPSILAERSKMSGIEDEDLRKKALVADGNATVLQSCLGYLKLKELNDLVERRQDHLKGLNDSSKQRQGHPSLPSEREEIRNHQRSMPSGTADHGIYRKEEIPFSYSAASSQVSSESKSMAGRLPLFSMSQGSEKSMDLQGGTTEDHIWNLHRMEDWLEERVRSCYNQSDAVDCSLQQLRFDAEAAHSRSRVDASVKAVVGDIYGLHQYSTDEIFTHASNAELQSLHIDWLTATLLQAWKRIVVLRDDVNDDASFLQFCMQAGTLDRLLIPVLESWGSDSHAVDVFIWAMAKGKKDIAREIVVRQFPPVFISNRSKAAVEDLHGPQRGWNKVETKDLSHRVKFSILEHEGFLIRLLGPVEHKTQWTTTPILRADAFSCWKEHFDALQQQSEEKMSVSAIREVLESGEPESPLRIAFRVRQSSPGIFPVMIAMGEYSAEDIDIHLPGQDTIQAVTSIGEYSDDELDDEPDDELARQATLRESIGKIFSSLSSSTYNLW